MDLKQMDLKQTHQLETGEIMVWKAGVLENDCYKQVYDEFAFIQLLVPQDALRVTQLPCKHADTCMRMRKSRVQFARVISITDKNGLEHNLAYSWYRSGFRYEVGKNVIPDKFDDDPNVCCGHGIHVHKFKEDCLVHEILEQERLERDKKNKETAVATQKPYNDAVLQILRDQPHIMSSQPLDYSITPIKNKSHKKKR